MTQMRLTFELGAGAMHIGRASVVVDEADVLTRMGELQSLPGVSDLSVEMLDNDSDK